MIEIVKPKVDIFKPLMPKVMKRLPITGFGLTTIDVQKIAEKSANVEPVPPTPVGPKDNEIWYTTTDGEIYDLGGIIETLAGMGATYNGPAVLSNEYDEEKQMWCMTFDDDVTILGDIVLASITIDGPFFITNQRYGLVCNVETIVLPKTTTRIGYGTFYNCSGLTSVEIPNSVTSIGNYAFSGCSGLTSVEIPNSVTSIGGSAFYNCSSLTSVTIPDSVTNIGEGAFYDCSSLESLTIGNGVTSIGDYVFYGCDSLTSINIPNSVTSIEFQAFCNCISLTSVTIPNSVTSIGIEAFCSCTSLTSVTCEATTPPTLGVSGVFYDTNNCPIYVPAESVEAYKAAENWSEYVDRIQAISN